MHVMPVSWASIAFSHNGGFGPPAVVSMLRNTPESGVLLYDTSYKALRLRGAALRSCGRASRGVVNKRAREPTVPNPRPPTQEVPAKSAVVALGETVIWCTVLSSLQFRYYK